MSTADDFIEIGDLVELVIQPAIYGMAIGFEGSLVHVRLADGSRVLFHEYELRKMTGADPEPVRNGASQEEDNVIDFTKARDLRSAKAKGMA